MKKVYVVIDAMLDIPRSQPGVIGVFVKESDLKECAKGSRLDT